MSWDGSVPLGHALSVYKALMLIGFPHLTGLLSVAIFFPLPCRDMFPQKVQVSLFPGVNTEAWHSLNLSRTHAATSLSSLNGILSPEQETLVQREKLVLLRLSARLVSF